MHPYVLNWRNPWDGETGFYKEDPAKHTLGFYEDLVQEAAEDLGIEDSPLLPGGDTPDDEDLIPDGGSRTQYFWSGEDGIAYHSEIGQDMVDPFFDTVEQAERYLESQADKHGQQRYEGLVLRKSGNQKVEEATEVLTEQSGLDQFAPDGGLDWKDVSHEYWTDLKEFEDRHPPRYVDPGRPIDHDTVDYFPHFLFQIGVHDAAGSQEEYEEVMDAVRFQEYGVDAVLD